MEQDYLSRQCACHQLAKSAIVMHDPTVTWI